MKFYQIILASSFIISLAHASESKRPPFCGRKELHAILSLLEEANGKRISVLYEKGPGRLPLVRPPVVRLHAKL